jgi:hypothetical protein
LRPRIALQLRTAHAGARQRLDDGLIILRLLAALLLVELALEFFLLLRDLGLLVRILLGACCAAPVLIKEVALFDIRALLSLACACGKQQRHDRQTS